MNKALKQLRRRKAPKVASAEAALRAVCDAAFAGNVRKVVDDLTSQAFVDMLQLVGGFNGRPAATSYTIEPLDPGEGGPHFILRLQTPMREIVRIASVSQIDGAWKVAGIKRMAPPP